jgi:hypothetical protein
MGANKRWPTQQRAIGRPRDFATETLKAAKLPQYLLQRPSSPLDKKSTTPPIDNLKMTHTRTGSELIAS